MSIIQYQVDPRQILFLHIYSLTIITCERMSSLKYEIDLLKILALPPYICTTKPL